MKPGAGIWLAVVIGALVCTPACFLSRNSKAAQMSLPAPTPSTRPANQPEPAAQVPLPVTTPSTEPANQPEPASPVPAPAPAAPANPTATQKTKPVRHKRAVAHVPLPSPPPASPAAPATAAVPVTSPAQLGEILTPAQKAELVRNLDQSLAAARQSLSKIKGRSLSTDQAETLRLVGSFQEQAESARQTDLTVAVQLARRAELLARDLASAMH